MLYRLAFIKYSFSTTSFRVKWFLENRYSQNWNLASLLSKKIYRYSLYTLESCRSIGNEKVFDLSSFSDRVKHGPSLRDLLQDQSIRDSHLQLEALDSPSPVIPGEEAFSLEKFPRRKLFIETYGCQMNVSDSEIIWSIMKNAGFEEAKKLEDADVVFLNTCAIREKAEQKIWERLYYIKNLQGKHKTHAMIGVLGCMAERLKEKLLEKEKLVHLVAGPDSYRNLPQLVSRVDEVGAPSINVLLSQEETYADISPVRTTSNKVSAFVSIMRGCNNMCSYCIVPFTRGRERSRPVKSIEEEVRLLSEQGYKEVILLGQNVNSYNYRDEQCASDEPMPMSKGFATIYKPRYSGVRFTHLLDVVSRIDPEMRVRFTSPHPKDFPDDLLELVKERPNICKQLHMPAQSGSTTVLERMRRGYSREAYIELVSKIKENLPNVGLSSDFICGFCGETDEEHLNTISLLEKIRYDNAFMFAYSMRERTHAHRHLSDDVPSEVKIQRLNQVIQTFNRLAHENNAKELAKYHLVLVDGESRRSKNEWCGRTDSNKKVIFPKMKVPTIASAHDQQMLKMLLNSKLNSGLPANMPESCINLGDYLVVQIDSYSAHSLRGKPIARTTLSQFHAITSTP